MNWYLKVVRDNYANFSGRAQRVEYWMFVLINVVISVVLSIVEQTAGLTSEPDALGQTQGYLTPIYSLIVLIPSMAVTIRRLHDVGKSGWWILIALTCIGVIPLLIWYISEGTPGDNQYGPNPREIDGPAPAAEDETGKAEDETGKAESEETDEEA